MINELVVSFVEVLTGLKACRFEDCKTESPKVIFLGECLCTGIFWSEVRIIDNVSS